MVFDCEKDGGGPDGVYWQKVVKPQRAEIIIATAGISAAERA